MKTIPKERSIFFSNRKKKKMKKIKVVSVGDRAFKILGDPFIQSALIKIYGNFLVFDLQVSFNSFEDAFKGLKDQNCILFGDFCDLKYVDFLSLIRNDIYAKFPFKMLWILDFYWYELASLVSGGYSDWDYREINPAFGGFRELFVEKKQFGRRVSLRNNELELSESEYAAFSEANKTIF